MDNWSLWRRMLINIDKALPNEEVARLMAKHYKKLHNELVRSKADEDIFNDTYLKLTYNYDNDFILLFRYYFNLLKGAYYRDAKSVIFIPIEDADVEETPEEEDIEPKLRRTIEDILEFKMEEIKRI